MSRHQSDDAGFIDLVDREYRGAVATATMIVGSRSVGEEIAQDVFERTYQRWSKVSTLDRPGAWVRRAVINQAISTNRKLSSERRALTKVASNDVISLVDGANVAEGSYGTGAGAVELWTAVAGLAPAQSTAVALHYGFDLSIESTAVEMGISESAVKSLLHRARSQLRGHVLLKEVAK